MTTNTELQLERGRPSSTSAQAPATSGLLHAPHTLVPDAFVLTLVNTNESMRHRAADCGLDAIVLLTELAGAQLDMIRQGQLLASAPRIAIMRDLGKAIGQQIDAHFDGAPFNQPLLARIKVTLQGLAASTTPACEELHPPKSAFYLSVRARFLLATGGGLLWMGASVLLALPWLGELGKVIGQWPALFAIWGIAIIPGFMNAFLLIGLSMDRRPSHSRLDHYPPITILIAAYDDAGCIADTIESIHLQAYPGRMDVIVVDDGSRDGTAAIVEELVGKHDWLRLQKMPKNGGKAKALNHALQYAKASLVITVDADSYLYQGALQGIVERYFEDPRNTRAVAGTVLVRNSRASWVTRAQEWDYFHGISAIKRVQSLFQGTLVAQGAFSLYDRRTLREAGAWPDCVGEDIVLTWAILKQGYRIGHSEQACLFTNAPATLSQFVKQRQRWSRGMIEGFKQHPDILFKARFSTFFVFWNLLFPLLDLAFTICFVPGIVLALFGHDEIVGPMTLALLPMGLGMNLLMYFVGNKSFLQHELRVRRTLSGFLVYTLAYSLIMRPACLIGYGSELLGRKKTR